MEEFDLDTVRHLIAEHLNSCPAFQWPTLPTLTTGVSFMRPTLTAVDVSPDSDDCYSWRFGVITSEFDVTDA